MTWIRAAWLAFGLPLLGLGCVVLGLTATSTARAQTGGLGITTEAEPPRDGGPSVATDDDDEGGLGVGTADEPAADAEGDDVSTGAADAGSAAGAEDAAGGANAGEADAHAAGEDAADPATAEAQPGEEDDAGEADPARDADGTDDAEESDDADESDEADEPAAPAGPTVRWNDGKVAGWAIFFASLGVGVGGAVLLAAGADDVNSIENAPGGTDWDDVVDAYERAPLLTGGGAAVLAVGVAGMAVGAVLLAIHGEDGTWMEAAIGPGTIELRGRF